MTAICMRFAISRLFLLGAMGMSLIVNAVPAKCQTSSNGDWVGTWAAAPMAHLDKSGMFSADVTLREIVHVSVGGSVVRIVLTNEFGTTDLKVGGVSLAIPAAIASTVASGTEPNRLDLPARPSGAVTSESIVPVRFGGRIETTIAPGAVAISDPVQFHLVPLSDIAISLFIPAQTVEVLSYHSFANQVNFTVDGNQVFAPVLKGEDTSYSWRFLKGVMVSGGARGAIVCLGDSITDGALSTANANQRYPDVLASRLQANPATAGWGILNEGIGGNAVLHDAPFTGPGVQSRFDRDVIAQPAVRYVILLEGINDIDRIANPKNPYEVFSAEDMIEGYRQLIVRAHLHGIKVIGATLTPFGGSNGESEAGKAIFAKVNNFIRTSGEFDGVVDFNKATADPDDQQRFTKAYGGHDHLHPSDAGYKSMADSIDLGLFAK